MPVGDQHHGGIAIAIAIGPAALSKRSTWAFVRYSRARTSALRTRFGGRSVGYRSTRPASESSEGPK